MNPLLQKSSCVIDDCSAAPLPHPRVCSLGVHVLRSTLPFTYLTLFSTFFFFFYPYYLLFYLSIYLPVVLFLSPPPPPLSTLLKRNLLFMLLNFSFWKIIAFSHRSQNGKSWIQNTTNQNTSKLYTARIHRVSVPECSIHRVSWRENTGFPCQSIPGSMPVYTGFSCQNIKRFLARIYFTGFPSQNTGRPKILAVPKYWPSQNTGRPKILGFPKIFRDALNFLEGATL